MLIVDTVEGRVETHANIIACDFAQTTNLLATLSTDGLLRVQNLVNQTELLESNIGLSASRAQIRWAANGNMLIAWSRYGLIVWDVREDKQLFSNRNIAIDTVAVSPFRNELALFHTLQPENDPLSKEVAGGARIFVSVLGLKDFEIIHEFECSERMSGKPRFSGPENIVGVSGSRIVELSLLGERVSLVKTQELQDNELVSSNGSLTHIEPLTGDATFHFEHRKPRVVRSLPSVIRGVSVAEASSSVAAWDSTSIHIWPVKFSPSNSTLAITNDKSAGLATVSALGFSSGGRDLFCVLKGAQDIVYRFRLGEDRATLTKTDVMQEPFAGCFVSSTGMTFITAPKDGGYRIRTENNASEPLLIPPGSQLAIPSSGSRFAFLDPDSDAWVYDTRLAKSTKLPTSMKPKRISVSTNGETVSIGDDSSTESWNAVIGKRIFAKPTDGLAKSLVSNDGHIVACFSETESAEPRWRRAVHLLTDSKLSDFRLAPNGEVITAMQLDNQHTLVTGNHSGVLRFWSTDHGLEWFKLHHIDCPIRVIAIAEQSSAMAVGYANGSVFVWSEQFTGYLPIATLAVSWSPKNG